MNEEITGKSTFIKFFIEECHQLNKYEKQMQEQNADASRDTAIISWCKNKRKEWANQEMKAINTTITIFPSGT